jgi:hypothetical protein
MATVLPSPDSPNAPKYWRHETGGELRIAVETFLNNRTMTIRQIALMRAYLRQWITSPVWDMNPAKDVASERALARLRSAIETLTSEAAIRKWIHQALDQGHDPL